MFDIIVADDDPSGRLILSKLLMKKDCRPILARNGAEAWNQIQSSKARIVITDWMMPGMNGLELCEKIRADKELDYIYIIIISANEEKTDAIEGLKAGADDYITKPIFPDELWARVRSGQRIIELEDNNKKVAAQLFQSDKMASIGQLAAGVAHEINNPIGFVNSNLKSLNDYVTDIKDLIGLYKNVMGNIEQNKESFQSVSPELVKSYAEAKKTEEEVDIDYIITDINDIINDCQEGTGRIKKIVADLKDFAHPGQDKMKLTNIADGIDSTLNVIQNEIKYKIEIIKQYKELPQILCYPQQLNQVFMNILVNAAHAIEEKGKIKITTSVVGDWVEVKIIDNGSGIEKENLAKIFDPFFTTKEVGAGTGLGMNVAYNIIQKHRGTIDVISEVGKGTVFTVKIPIKAEETHE